MEHVHRWLVDNEGVGVCRYCGAIKVFPQIVYDDNDEYLSGAMLTVPNDWIEENSWDNCIKALEL